MSKHQSKINAHDTPHPDQNLIQATTDLPDATVFDNLETGFKLTWDGPTAPETPVTITSVPTNGSDADAVFVRGESDGDAYVFFKRIQLPSEIAFQKNGGSFKDTHNFHVVGAE